MSLSLGSSPRRRASALLAALIVLSPACPAAAEELSIRLDTGDEGWVRQTAPLRIRLSRVPPPAEGRLAVLLGQTDVTDLFRHDGLELIYRPDLLPLPAGEHDLQVFLVDREGTWTQVGQDTVSVLTRAGFRESELTPRLDLRGNGRLDATEPSSSGDATFEKATLQGDVRGRWVRGAWEVESAVNVLGATEQEDALRFGTEGDRAPLVDLSSYRLRLARGGGRLAVGHVSYGDNPFLVDRFASRGLTAGLPIGSWGRFGMGALNGTSIVGWDDVVGLEESDHRFLAGGFGFDLLPERPATLSLGLTYLDGSLLPRSGFNANTVNDRETSRGWGVTLNGATPSRRVELEAAWATSSFDNPTDPLLAQGADLVPVEEEERQAWLGRLTLGLLQGETVGSTTLDLSLGLHHQRVEPQYRSTAVFLQADRQVTGADLSLALGPVQSQLGYTETEDDLDDVPSVLGTVTRQTTASLALPFARLGRSSEGSTWWIPTLSYQYARTHQAGEDLPVDGGFSPGHVPDQMSTSHGVALDWSGARWRLGYRFDLSEQDNRQPGREEADFETRIHSWSISVHTHRRLDLDLELSRERAWRGESGAIETTDRYGPGFLWRPTDRLTFDGRYSFTETEDEPPTAASESGLLDLQTAYRLDWGALARSGVSGQLFVRYSENAFTSKDRIFGVDVDRGSHTFDAGLNLSFE